MAYCVNCGTKLVENAKFCQKCGCSIGVIHSGSERQQEYTGKIYKCPVCGEILKSFEINCPACGHELRGTRATNSVREFALKLEAIEAGREYIKPRFFTSSYELQQISKPDEQKISLIKSFPIPNTKEDLLEFMILATTSINTGAYDSTNPGINRGEKELSAAWLSKAEQVYEKAKRAYSTDSIFLEIKSLYDSCNEKVEKAKKKAIKKWCLMLGWMPLVLIIAIILTTTLIRNEDKKLEDIVVEVQIAIENEEFEHALRLADSLDFRSLDTDLERKWDIQRAYWVEKVIEEASKHGIDLEYTPSTDVDNANYESETITGGVVEGFKEALQPGIESIKENVEEFNRIMNGEDSAENPN